MSRTPGPMQTISVVGRLAADAMMRRLTGKISAATDHRTFREGLQPWVESLSHEVLAGHGFVRMPATQPPWTDAGIDVETGDRVSVFSDGRVNLSKLLDIWVAPPFQLWLRIGERGPIFRGTRRTHTFTAEQSGRLYLASYFPGEWSDTSGQLGTDVRDYAKVSGELSVLVMRWNAKTDVAAFFRELTAEASAPELALEEQDRQANPVDSPAGWNYLWYLGPGEIFRPARTDAGHPSICCHTHEDVGILRKDASLPLRPGTCLNWSWKVDQLPSRVAEHTLPSHDYLSIAVEFDDGQDITYYRSAELPEGTVYRCPLPTWKDKETHVVVRSGQDGLGRWLNESRDLYEDYRRHIGGTAGNIVRVWLIAVSLFQRGDGRCEYADISLVADEKVLKIL